MPKCQSARKDKERVPPSTLYIIPKPFNQGTSQPSHIITRNSPRWEKKKEKKKKKEKRGTTIYIIFLFYFIFISFLFFILKKIPFLIPFCTLYTQYHTTKLNSAHTKRVTKFNPSQSLYTTAKLLLFPLDIVHVSLAGC